MSEQECPSLQRIEEILRRDWPWAEFWQALDAPDRCRCADCADYYRQWHQWDAIWEPIREKVDREGVEG